jgi:hypothetical protein
VVADRYQEILKMKTMILAAFAALSVGVGVANAQSLSHNAAPQQRTGNQHNWLNGGG